MKLEKLNIIICNFKYYLILIFLSLLPLVSVFITSDLHHTHDGLVHLARLGAFYKSLTDGQFPVRWVADLNYGYGMPLFNYIYHLPYLVSSVFLFLGFGLVNSFKISLSLSYVLSAVFMFSYAKIFFEDNKKAFLVTVFYQFATFRIIEVITRGSFGEVYAYTFFPLVLFGLTGIFKNINPLKEEKKQKLKNYLSLRFIVSLKFLREKLVLIYCLFNKAKFYFFVTSFSSAFLVLSHNALSLAFFAVSVLYLLFFACKKAFLFGLSALLSGLMLSSFYWIPAIAEHKYTYGNLFMKDMYLKHFPPLQNFFIPNLTNDLSLQTGGIAVQVGFFHVLAIFLSLIILFRVRLVSGLNFVNFKQFDKKMAVFCLGLIIVSLVLMQPVSKIFWENIPFLKQFQFPWRLLGVMVFSTSLLSANILNFNFFRKKIIYLSVIVLVVFSSFGYWVSPEGYDKIDEKYYWDYPLNTTYFGETDLVWSAGPAGSYPKNKVDIIGGKAEIKNYLKKSNLQSFDIKAKTESQVVIHTQYFPGWRVYVGRDRVPIQFQDQNWRGQITFFIPEGSHNVKIVFGESNVRAIADMLSVISFLMLIILLFIVRKKIVYDV